MRVGRGYDFSAQYMQASIYPMKQPLYVMKPDMSTVEKAKKLIDEVKKG